MSRKNLLIGLVVVVIVVVAGFAIARSRKNKASTAEPTPTPTAQTQNQSTPNTSQAMSTDATIKYSSSGFSPASLTVKNGQTITIENDTSSTMQFDSNPHPQHTANTELNVGSIAPGKTMTFVVDKAGTWGYHNHLKSSDTGSIIVQ